MGVVYEARQVALGRTVALKILAGTLGMDPTFKERFRHEGRIQAALDHPHIVTIFEAGEWEDSLFIAMRLVRGPNLKEMIIARELEGARTLRILRPIAEALDSAHEAGLIHRDIKPQNILVGSRDRAYLADFGLTKGIDDAGLTQTGQFVGTIDYIAPEQIRGEQATSACDIYALAAVLYECLTRRGAVPEALGRGGHVRAPVRAAAAGDRPAPGAAPEPRRGHLQGDGQGPEGPLRDRERDDRRRRAGARQARARGDHAARADRGARGGRASASGRRGSRPARSACASQPVPDTAPAATRRPPTPGAPGPPRWPRGGHGRPARSSATASAPRLAAQPRAAPTVAAPAVAPEEGPIAEPASPTVGRRPRCAPEEPVAEPAAHHGRARGGARRRTTVPPTVRALDEAAGSPPTSACRPSAAPRRAAAGRGARAGRGRHAAARPAGARARARSRPLLALPLASPRS